jgi:transketolase
MTPTAAQIRLRILEMAFSGQTVHIPSAFSIVEIVRTLHDRHLKYPNNDADSESRDFLVLSKGHGVMALYPILEARGWVPELEIENYFQDGSLLPGLCEAHIPGCEVNGGSLGQGLSVAAGLAWSARLRKSDQKVFCLIGDGELNEGTIWEALLFSASNKLGNLVVIMDANGLQAMGETSQILAFEDLPSSIAGLGFEVRGINGHSEDEINSVLDEHSYASFGKPLFLIAKTVKGKGVSFIEDDNTWHYTRLDYSTYGQAVAEIRARL